MKHGVTNLIATAYTLDKINRKNGVITNQTYDYATWLQFLNDTIWEYDGKSNNEHSNLRRKIIWHC